MFSFSLYVLSLSPPGLVVLLKGFFVPMAAFLLGTILNKISKLMPFIRIIRLIFAIIRRLSLLMINRSNYAHVLADEIRLR